MSGPISARQMSVMSMIPARPESPETGKCRKWPRVMIWAASRTVVAGLTVGRMVVSSRIRISLRSLPSATAWAMSATVRMPFGWPVCVSRTMRAVARRASSGRRLRPRGRWRPPWSAVAAAQRSRQQLWLLPKAVIYLGLVCWTLRAGDVPVRHGGDELEFIRADGLAAGCAGHVRADRVVVVFGPQGRFADGPFVAPGAQRVHRGHEFPARGGEVVSVPRPARR